MNTPAMIQRRALLTTAGNPDARHDYVVTLTGEPMAGTRLRLRYVPDRWVLEAEGFRAYVGALGAFAGSLEALALAVLEDLSNEAVPRWAEVRAARDSHEVVAEDRQPGWDNPALIARLERY